MRKPTEGKEYIAIRERDYQQEVKAMAMLKRVEDLAFQIYNLARFDAQCKTEKQRDKVIVKIMDLTEEIEEQYSTNWH